MPKVKANEIEIYYEIHGNQGPYLLLIMGLASDSSHFSMQIRRLSQYYKVIVFDNRGVGQTETTQGEYTVAMMANDTLGLLNALRVQSAHILGFSLGGYIAQQIAVDAPERVKSLILANTALYSYPRAKHVQNSFLTAIKKGLQHEDHIALLMPWLFSPKFFNKLEQVNFFIKMASMQGSNKQSLEGHMGQIAAANQYNGKGKLRYLKMPVLLIAATEDLLTPLSCLEEIQFELPQAETILLKNAGHCSYLENAEKFNEAVLSFLQETGDKTD